MNSKAKMIKSRSKGGRNLLWLGVMAILIACITTTTALVIYHQSGDIYLDRSRPGFLPDESEIVKDEQADYDDYNFANDGVVTADGLETYLEHFETEIEKIDDYAEPFGEKILSDEELDIVIKND